jgi:pimeloyl-ACP methyl ester carboxylesterase
MPQATTPEGLTLHYETTGSPADPALLLVNGLGSQLISWPDELCERLAAAGRLVIRFDNRDSGLSSKLDGQVADVEAITAAVSRGDLEAARALAPYRLSAMAGDAVALLDALGIERAHAVGSSMGGAIVQRLAIEHPERLHTLTSIMATTGEPGYGRSSPEARAALFAPSPRDRAAYVEASRKALVWASRRYADLDAIRAQAGRSYDRCFCPDGSERQLAAMIVDGSRADGLRKLQVPTLVIHGLDDTLIDPSGGRRTAELVPGARLLLVEDMGHDRPPPLWPLLCEAILAHTARADAA